MERALSTDVVVVGAGPTGLMLAAELRLHGVDVLVLEKRPTGTTGESRAPGINARSMEVFGQRGFADMMFERGRRMPAVVMSGMMIFPGQIDPEWPDALILAQHETEKILGDRATGLGAQILWSTEFLHLVQDDAGVDVIVADSDGVKTIRTKYLVGCDGGRSRVRDVCGAKTQGDDPLSHWLVADVKLASPPSDKESFGRNIRVGSYQVSRAEPGWHRISIMTLTSPVDRSAPVTIEELRQALLDGLGTDFGLEEARWMSRFADGFRQVDSYRHGKVLLAGDASHTHAPIGGQGLNLGVQDAVNLGWKLAAVLKDGSSDALLDSYHEERHPVGAGVLELARAQTALIKPGRQIDALRAEVREMLELPEITLKYCGILSGLALRYAWGEGEHPLVGRRMPNLALSGVDNAPDVFTLMHGGRPLLLTFTGGEEISVPEEWRARIDSFKATTAFEDGDTWQVPALGPVSRPAAVFVRPDGYVAWVCEAGQPFSPASLSEAIGKWLG